MKKSEHLFYLIKSLSKSEKRSFKLFVKQSGNDGKNNYTCMFDVIEKMHDYDQEILVKRLKGKIPVDAIPTVKVQLNKLILKSLRNSKSEIDVGFELRQQQDHIQILFEKGLYSQCKQVLNKAKEHARINESFLTLDQLSIMEYHIALKEASIEGLQNYIEHTYPEVEKAREINNTQAEFEKLAAEIRLLQLESSSISGFISRTRLDKIVDNPIMHVDIETYPLHCQIDYHTIWGHYYYLTSNQSKTYEHRKTTLNLIEKSTLSERNWLTHARFLLISLTTFKMFDEFDRELAHITGILAKTPSKQRSHSFQGELDTTLYNIRFHRDLDAGNFTKISSYSDELEVIFDSSLNHIDTNLRMAFCFNMSYAELGNENYKSALRWSNAILNNSEMKNMRVDIQCYVRIVTICVHHALGNYELIPSLVKSAKRLFVKNDRLSTIIDSFLSFARKHLINPYSIDQVEIYSGAVEEWRGMSGEINNQTDLEYVDFVSWIISIQNPDLSMEDVIRKNDETKKPPLFK
jgi:hypothetical protein